MAHEKGPSTLSVHAGDPRPDAGPVEAPLCLSSAFAFPDAAAAEAAFRGERDAYIYGRWGNPTVEALEAKVAVLEGGEAAVATASGMAAVSGVVLSVAQAGDHVVAPRGMYGESARLLRDRLPRFGIETTFVDDVSADSYEAAMRPNTRLLYVETPANPTLAITDLAQIADLAKRRGVVSVADNTFATPMCQQPLSHGIDISLHSLTKALCGHGDAIGGVVVTSRERRDQIFELVVKGFGGVLAPFNAFLLSRGMRTVALRMRHSCASAREIAAALERHPSVAAVHYPGLESHPGHAVAARQMNDFGALVAFELKGGVDAGRRVLSRVQCITHAVSLGDCRSLITHPASTTASTMPRKDRLVAGIADGLLRLSVGIEDVEDLLQDLRQAL